jgi:hypothetical protein
LPDPGVNPSCHGGKPVTNRFSVSIIKSECVTKC